MHISFFWVVPNILAFNFFPRKALNRIWLTLVGMHLAILLVFAVIKLFLAARYPLALAVTILILIPFALERVAQAIRWHQLRTPARVLVMGRRLALVARCRRS